MFCLNKGNIAHSSCSIWCTSYKNEIKNLFENFIKEKVFSTNDEVERTLGLIVVSFFLTDIITLYLMDSIFAQKELLKRFGHRVHQHNLDEV